MSRLCLAVRLSAQYWTHHAPLYNLLGKKRANRANPSMEIPLVTKTAGKAKTCSTPENTAGGNS